MRCDAGAAFSKHLDLGPSVILIFVFMLIGILHVEYINKTVFKLSISIQMNPHLSLTTTFQLLEIETTFAIDSSKADPRLLGLNGCKLD